MDKKFLQEQNLEKAQKKFQLMVEYAYMGNTIEEADAPAPQDMPQQGGYPSMMGDDPNMGGEDPSMMGGDPGMGQGVEGFNPQMGGDMPQEDGMDEEMPEEDEEVIDVDDLTSSQESTEHKVNVLDKKLDKFMGMIDKLVDNIDANNAHIEQLRQDFEKRNPTQVEKMTLRAKQGYPFNQSPDDYWTEKEKEGNYSAEDDNNGVDDKRYQITKNDVNNITDWASIYKSIDDGSFHQDLKDILNF